MPKTRKVGNMLALGILSVLVTRPMHPYEMATTLRGWGKDQDLPIKWGSLYTVVRNLAKHGFIEESESGREGRRPERTVYRITASGRAELLDWARELVSGVETEFPRFRAGLSVLGAIPPDEATALLQQRLVALQGMIAARTAALARHAETVPRLFLVEDEYEIAMLTAEAAWMRSLIAELVGGSLPGMAEWRHFHAGGLPSRDPATHG